MSERSHRHNPAAHSRSRPTRAKRGGPSLTHRPYPTANPAISIASVPRQRWVPNRGKQTAAPLSLKRGTRRECRVHANSPLKDIACVLLAQTKDVKIVCVCHRVSNNEDTDLLTISNALLVLAMIERNCTLTRMHASNKTVSEEDEVFSRRSLYYGHAGSDVMGCRRPTDGVFTYVSSDTSHAEGVPHSNP